MSTAYLQALTQYQAGSGSIIGATSIILTSFIDIYGNAITNMTPFGSLGYGTAEPDTTNEEGFTFSSVTANANGTVTLGGVKTILAQTPYTQTAGLVRQHSGGTKIVITDNVAFWATFGNKQNDEALVGRWTTPVAPLAGNDIVNKTYADGLAIAGAPDSSTTVKGIGRVSVAPVSPTIPIFVGDNDPRVPTQGENDALVGTSGTPSSSNKYVTNADTATTATANAVARRLAGGNVTVVTETPGNNTTNAASTAFVTAAVIAGTTGLGTWTDVSANANGAGHQVAQDGFLVGDAGLSSNGVGTIVIKSDSSATPTTTRQQISISNSGSGNGCPFMIPVKKNDYYLVSFTGLGVLGRMFFISIGN